MTHHEIRPNNTIGNRFRIECPLGTGGLGTLYRAEDTKTDRLVAIRILDEEITHDDAILEQLRAGVRAASKLLHKNIGRVFGIGKEGGIRYIASEFIDGQSLRHLIQHKRDSGRTFSFKGAYNIVAHLCNALHFAHNSTETTPLFHGLPGPGSILINRQGRIKLTDFGIISALPPHASVIDHLGDRHYLSPEGEIDPRNSSFQSDIYTIGCIIYELLTGRLPVANRPPMADFVQGIPSDIERIVDKCLEPDPRQRFGDTDDIKRRLFAALERYNAGNIGTQLDVGDSEQQGLSSDERYQPTATGNKRTTRQHLGAHSMPQHPLDGHLKPKTTTKPAAAQPTIHDLLNEPEADEVERWLIRKNRLDYGPFSLATAKQKLFDGEFSTRDEVVDQESGEACIAQKHPALSRFCRVLEAHNREQNAKRAASDLQTKRRRRRTVVVTAISASAMIIMVAAAAVYVVANRPREEKTTTYREKKESTSLKGLKFTWNREPPSQAKKRRRIRRKNKRQRHSGTENATFLGDVSKEGGDGLLSQKVIEETMKKNANKLTRCVLEQVRRQPDLSKISIAFGVRGVGRVSYVKVNGASSGPFHACVAAAMRQITFPRYDGVVTHASFAMSLQY